MDREEEEWQEDEEEESEEKFRLCPSSLRQHRTGCSLVWRLASLLLCLPLCYPCYLTKQYRAHRRRKVEWKQPSNPTPLRLTNQLD